VLSTSNKPSKKRPAQLRALMQKTTLTNPSVRKENNMNHSNVSVKLEANGQCSFSKTLVPLALAVACSVSTGGQFHYAHPYVSF
jgi:hypothetical protein